MIRRHRVLELFLVEVLGYTWDQVHEEAERLEHAASDDLVDRMAGVLGTRRRTPTATRSPPPAAGSIRPTCPSWPTWSRATRPSSAG
jgi:DtxR family transcriptional regulator, Mn-dependent transcriptional regulator